MLRFFEYGKGYLEVPNEISLLFYISDCQHNCQGCHSTWLQEVEHEPLKQYYSNLLALYQKYVTCICFLGEGRNGEKEHEEFAQMCQIAREYGLKTCLYSGRDCSIEEWMNMFDFVKIGSYKEECGPITNPLTNQRMYMNVKKNKVLKGYFQDITELFWKE